MNLLDKLENIGFTDKEAKIYLALLELGESSVSRISEKAKIKKTTCYDVIESLKNKGLVESALVGTRIKYSIEDPRFLLKIIDERKSSLESILPELRARARALDLKPKVRYMEGEEGIKKALRDVFNYPDTPLKMLITETSIIAYGTEFQDEMTARRIKVGIPAKIVAPNTQIANEFKKKDRLCLRKTILDPMQLFPSGAEMRLYGNKVICLISYDEELGIIVHSVKLFQALQNVFNGLWSLHGGD